MRAFSLRQCLLGVCLLFHALVATTVGQTDGRLTVREAIDRAMEHSPVLKQIDAAIRSKSGDILAQTSPPAPRLSYMEEGIPVGAPAGFAERRWTVSQSLEIPLRTLYRYNRLDNQRTALGYELEDARVQLRAEVKKAYAEVAHGIHVLRLRSMDLSLVGRMREAVYHRTDSTRDLNIEQYKADIVLADAQNDFDDAERALHRARYSLFTLMGVTNSDDLYDLAYPDSLVYIETRIPQEDVVGDVSKLPLARMFQCFVDAAHKGVSEAWSSLLPGFDVMYYRQNYGDGLKYYGVELGVTLPLWFMFDQRGQIMTAEAAQEDAYDRRVQAELDLKREVEVAWHGYESSRRTIERYTRIMQAKAPALIELTLERYRAGYIDLLDLLDAQRTFQSSQLRYADLLLDYYLQMIDLERFLPSEIVFLP
jgi:outer membrane protein, heavy metal efflux system